MKKNTYGSYWFNLKSTMKNYKVNPKDLKELQSKDELSNFNYKNFLIANSTEIYNDENYKDVFRFTSMLKNFLFNDDRDNSCRYKYKSFISIL